MRSMTGYGQGSAEGGHLRVEATLRSVNHRNLDLVLRVPEELRRHELEIREAIGGRLFRGRVEVRIDVENRRRRQVRVEVEKGTLAALEEAVAGLQRDGHAQDGLQFRDLLRVPDALLFSIESDPELDVIVWSLTSSALEAALEQLVEARAGEGEKLDRILRDRLNALGRAVQQISDEQPEISERLASRLKERWQDLAASELPVDESRLAQELAYLVERSDVREELDRLTAHQAHFQEVVADDGPIGKRLDFLAQEMHRELTTLSSKCRDTAAMELTLDAKLLCEQLREQIQNIE